MQSFLKFSLTTLLLLFLIIIPLIFKNPYFLHIIIMAGIFVLLASSMNLITGCTGRLNLGHAGFYGLGAYGSTLLVMKMGFPVWIGMLFGGMISTLFGVLIGVPCLKLRGSYLAITTLAFGEITRLAFINLVELTNGPLGIREIPGPPPLFLPKIGLIQFESKIVYYYLIFFICLICLLIIYRIMNSQIGNTFIAIREDEIRAETVGIDTIKIKIINFALGAFFAGIAGSFYAHYVRFISPDTFTLNETFTILTMVVIGGLGTFWGPVLGGVIFTFLPELLRAIADYRMIIYGLLMTVSIIFMPEGLIGIFRSLRTKKLTE